MFRRINFFLVTFLILTFSCKMRVEEKYPDYKKQIYSWFAANSIFLEGENFKWFLYFDDKLSCNVCKLEILSKVNSNPEVAIITRFDSDFEKQAFVQTYHLKNKIVNIKPGQSEWELSIPFIFHKEKNGMLRLTLLEDELLAESDWTEFLENPN